MNINIVLRAHILTKETKRKNFVNHESEPFEIEVEEKRQFSIRSIEIDSKRNNKKKKVKLFIVRYCASD